MPKRIYAAADYLPHLQTLATFADWERVSYGGGEPFLHPDLGGLIDATAFGKPVAVYTNGFWLSGGNWIDRVLPVAKRCAELGVSRYPPYVDRVGVVEWDNRLELLKRLIPHLHVFSFHPDDPKDLTFQHSGFHDAPLPLADPPSCPMRHCYQLTADGRVAKCPIGLWVDTAFGVSRAFVDAAPSLYYDLARGGEGWDDWEGHRETVAACALCGLGTGHVADRPWRETNKLTVL